MNVPKAGAEVRVAVVVEPRGQGQFGAHRRDVFDFCADLGPELCDRAEAGVLPVAELHEADAELRRGLKDRPRGRLGGVGDVGREHADAAALLVQSLGERGQIISGPRRIDMTPGPDGEIDRMNAKLRQPPRRFLQRRAGKMLTENH